MKRQNGHQTLLDCIILEELLSNQRLLDKRKWEGLCHQFIRQHLDLSGLLQNDQRLRHKSCFFLFSPFFPDWASNGRQSPSGYKTASSVREYNIKPPGKTGHKSWNSFEYIFSWCQLINNSLKNPGYVSRGNVLQHHFGPWCIIKKNNWLKPWLTLLFFFLSFLSRRLCLFY